MTGRRRVPALLLLGAVGGLAACGDEEVDRVGEAEAGIATALGERLGADVAGVTVACPDDASLEAGTSLACEVTVGDGTAQDVSFTIGEAGVVSPTEAVIPTAAVETYLAEELATPAESAVEVDCGEATLVVHDVGGTLTCTAVRSADGVAFDVIVEVRSLDGSVTYTVVATTTTTAPPPPVDPAATTTTAPA